MVPGKGRSAPAGRWEIAQIFVFLKTPTRGWGRTKVLRIYIVGERRRFYVFSPPNVEERETAPAGRRQKRRAWPAAARKKYRPGRPTPKIHPTNPPQTSSLHSEVRGPRVWSSRFHNGFHPGEAGWNTNAKGHISQKKLLRKGKAGLTRSGQKEKPPRRRTKNRRRGFVKEVHFLF